MTEIRSINAIRANRENDNGLLTPVEALMEVAEDIRSGEVPCTSVLILTLDRGADDNEFNIKFSASNLRCSEMISVLECAKARILGIMDYGGEQ